MDKRINTTEATRRDTLDAKVVFGLETQLSDLRNMAAIAATLMDPHVDFDGPPGSRHLRIPEEDAEQLSFAIYETDRRARELMLAFNSAYHAGRGE